jgi:hypothetical protein
MNGFSPVPAYPPIDFGGVARSNVETLRFTAGLDLTKERTTIATKDLATAAFV